MAMRSTPTPFRLQVPEAASYWQKSLGLKYPQHVIGIHLNRLAFRRDPKELVSSPEENNYIEELKQFQKGESGYQWIQGTRPQTLAYGLGAGRAHLHRHPALDEGRKRRAFCRFGAARGAGA